MGLDYPDDTSSTLLSAEEKEALALPGIQTRAQLDEVEQSNIEEAIQWLPRSLKPAKIFSEKFILDLHKRMYGQVWNWAGKYRRTNTNLGIDWYKIPEELRKLLDDALYWVSHDTYSADEIAIRFKYRLVSIHCFPNGNGRHSRLMADIIIEKIFNRPVFSWGAANLTSHGDGRNIYLAAMHTADTGDIKPLMDFSRS